MTNCIYLESTATSLPNDSTYASMTEDSPNYFNCTIGDEYNFADQSTKEIFSQLLDIGPSKSAQMDSNRNEEVEENMNDGSEQQTEPIELVSSSPNCNEEVRLNKF